MNLLALDLSLRGAGMVALPLDWGGDFTAVARHHVGESLSKDASEELKIGRLVRLSAAIVAFAREHHCEAAYVEQYAFTSRHVQAHSLGELGGVVKHQLVTQLGLVTVSVAPASARKLLLGKLPRKDVKIAVRVALTDMGLPMSWTGDEADALVIGNHASLTLGGFAFVVPEPVEEKKTRRRAA